MPATTSGATLLAAVREKMKASSVAALIVPSADPHNSEYVATHLQARAFISNFKGSAGTALITMDQALMWADGRYWIEAADNLYPEFQLMKLGQLEVPSVEEWIVKNLGKKTPVGLCPYLATVAEWERLGKTIQLTPVENYVAAMMPPEKEIHPVFIRPAEFCGASCKERRTALLEVMDKEKCDLMVLTALDEVAWFTNLRGADVDYNPVFYSYAIVDKSNSKTRVYVNMAKISDEVRSYCHEYIEFLPYEHFEEDLRKISTGRSALVDERQTTQAVFDILKECAADVTRVMCGPAQKLKGVKNEVELKGFRESHVRDGAALTRYLAWLTDQIGTKNVTTLNEYDAGLRLGKFRGENERFVQLSFPTITSTGPNGAMCHYSASTTDSAVIKKDQLYLVDSGAQYLDGTTDVTRTICFSAPREEEKEAYTLVLKGHIAINTLSFPKGTDGGRLDSFARYALWQVGLDYAHGTGHGVGSFLNVHEGPHGIGIRPMPTGVPMQLHSVVSNEPGYYKEGHYGIRIENLEEVVVHPTKYSKDGFLGFSQLTMTPLCRDLIDVSALTEKEREWVNTYHAKVVAAITPFLEKANDTLALDYLKYHTQPI